MIGTIIFPGGKWFSMIGGMMLIGMSGTIYIFPVYAPSLKDKLDWSQFEVNFVGSALTVGLSCTGLASGLLFDKGGLLLTGFFGALLLLAGYILAWAAISFTH